MYIKTSDFILTKEKYFQIITTSYFKTRWWLIFILLLLFFYAKVASLVVLIIFWFAFALIYFWFFTTSKKNKIFFASRYYEINDEFIIGYLKDGSIDKINLSNIVKAMKMPKYYLLYISRTNFVYLPLECLQSEEDRKNLVNLLEGKKL
ncbi:MAG: hypothetical protein Q8N85_01380 [Candidatus Omnitrophota bacterium]|nr:hypothetical protein [Candidatus Omnitrophota bacterium]